MDYFDFWAQQTTSGRDNEGKRDYFLKRAKEFAALMLPEERALPAVDMGCGAGEILQYLVRWCNIKEAFDYSPSVLEEAKRRLSQGAIKIYKADATEHYVNLDHPIWITAASVNQYIAPQQVGEIVKYFAAVPTTRTFFLFDTIDPARYRLWQARLIATRADFYRPTWKRRLFFIGKLFLESIRTSKLWFRLEGVMGYAYRPYFWHVLGKEAGLEVEIVNSWYLEYRYHVIFRKARLSGGP